MRTQVTAVIGVLLLVMTAAVPAAVAASETGSTLAIGVSQGGTGTVTVTVTANGTAVTNASVDVTTADANDTYAGTGTYTTNANGTVTLPAPAEPVAINVSATAGNASGTTQAALQVPSLSVQANQSADGQATVSVEYAISGAPVGNATVTVTTVDSNATYAGTGSYQTTNGTIQLPAPDQSVTVAINASADGLTGHTTVTLQNASTVGNEPFGARVSAFVHQLLTSEHGIGRSVAQWVLAHNPGHAPDHAGPSDHAGPNEHSSIAHESHHDDHGNRSRTSDHQGNDGHDNGPNTESSDHGPGNHQSGHRHAHDE